MTTMADFLVETMSKSGPGIKGTPSEMSPENIAGGLSQTGIRETRPEKAGILPSWSKPLAKIGALLPTTLGAWLVAKGGGKKLFGEKGKRKVVPYQERVSKIVVDLRGRGYEDTDIQSVLDVLAKAYGEEPANVEEYRVY